MIVEYVGGPVDGREEQWTAPLPEFMYVPSRPVARFVKEAEPPPRSMFDTAHRYRLRDVVGGVASYVFVREN